MKVIKGERRVNKPEIRRFVFGDVERYGGWCVILERSFERAKNQFIATVINPVNYVTRKDYAVDENGYHIRNENQVTDYDPCYVLKDNPRIEVQEKVQRGQDWETVETHYIFLKECVDFDYGSIHKVAGYLGSQNSSTSSELIKSDSGTQFRNKRELMEMRNQLAQKQQELEIESRRLREQVAKLNEEISSKVRLLQGIQIYLGVDCETFELVDGCPANQNEKLHIYQQVCFVDEELSIWKDCWKIEGGADYKNLRDFEEFIKNHFKEYMPHSLSVLAWRIRRHVKDYGDYWSDMINNQLNFLTIILIRDGERLIELMPEIRLKETFFPTASDFNRVVKEAEKWNDENKIRQFYEKYMFSLLFLQGIIDNTDLLPYRFKGENLFKDTSPQVVFVRDAEQEYWLTDGRPSWSEFISDNRRSICVGCRCIYLGIPDYYVDYHQKAYDRTGIRYISHPESPEIYTIEKVFKLSPRSVFDTCEFLYLPKDDVYDPINIEYRARRKRVGWRCYRDELMNIDAITIEEIDYYLKKRSERKEYLTMMPALFKARQMLEREKLEEEGFKLYILGEIDFEVSEEQLDEAIRIFKTRKYNGKEERKWKRGIFQEGPAAVKMVRKILISLVKNNIF